MINPVVHLELRTGDLAAASDSYSRLRGRRPERIETDRIGAATER
jgi:hypothetical protein